MIYIKFLLERVIKLLLEADNEFIFKEDSDLSYVKENANSAYKWKEDYYLKCYFNFTHLINFESIEYCWLISDLTDAIILPRNILYLMN